VGRAWTCGTGGRLLVGFRVCRVWVLVLVLSECVFSWQWIQPTRLAATPTTTSIAKPRQQRRNRWGATAADEARRVGDLPVSDYLEKRAATEAAIAAEAAAAATLVQSDGSVTSDDEASDARPDPAGLAAMVAAVNAARGSFSTGRSSVDVAAAVQTVLAGGDNGGSNGNGSAGAGPAAANGNGKGSRAPGKYTNSNGNLRPPLEPVHRAVAVGHAWSVVMPRGGAGGGAARGKAGGGGGGGAKRAG